MPWVDEPLPLYHTPTAQLVRYAATAPPCDASQLRLRFGRTGAATGHYFQELDVVNAGRRVCLIGRQAALTAVGTSGRIVVHPSSNGTFFGQLLPANVAPGGHVLIDLETVSVCPTPAKRYKEVSLELPTGIVHSAVSIVVQCGIRMSRIGLPEQYAAPHAREGTPGKLDVRVVLPRVVTHDSLLRYTVVLRNPTSRPVRLEPCPGYTESLFAQRAYTRRSYRLNCKPLASIAPHASQRFAMQLQVPAHVQGISKFGWSLDTPSGPFAGGAVSVR